MIITIGAWRIADVRIQGVTLRPIIGSYELVFSLDLLVANCDNGARHASIIEVRVSVKSREGESKILGTARPEGLLQIICKPYSTRGTPSLLLHLHPGQLAALESLRDTGDLTFEFTAWGTGADENGDQYAQGKWNYKVPRSDWIRILREAEARNVLLLEVPLPLESISDDWKSLATELRSAEERYHNGDYHSCIGSCRTVIEELGSLRNWGESWATESLVGLTDHKSRKAMSKDQRELALCAALRHYTHQAHHSRSEGGALGYTRAEAQYVLSLTAAIVAFAKAGKVVDRRSLTHESALNSEKQVPAAG